MNTQLQRIFEYKYAGIEYPRIRELLLPEYGESTYSALTMKTELAPSGGWYPMYRQYEEEEGERRVRNARSLFRKEVENATKVIINALAQALKDGKYKEATAYAQLILTYGNVREIDQKDASSELKTLSDEQFRKLFAENGIDASSIFPNKGSTKTKQDQ